MSTVVRRLAAAVVLIALLFAFPGAVGATITGGCQAEGHSTSSSANLTTDTVWHLHRDDIAGGSGTAPAKMKVATINAYALGIALPIANGQSDAGETAGAVEGLSVATYAILGARFTVAGSAAGDGSCNGRITILLDDVNPLLTILGGGGILVAIVCLLILIALARGGNGCLPRIIGLVFGALGGTGAALAGEQFGVLDSTQVFGLIVAIAAGIIGFFIPGIFGSKDLPAPPPTPTAPPPMTNREMGSTAADIFSADESGASPADGTSTERYPSGGEGGGGPM